MAFLLHEPLLKKARELAAHDRKVRKALAKHNRERARALEARRPKYRLDHLVRERYPAFVDAVRDLDDPLTLVHLFAALPADARRGVPAPAVHAARRLALEWQAWVARAGALRRAFVSVKGYYFQAEVAGQAVTWLAPHPLAQVLPPDVDFKVMGTFLELHCATLAFVLFKLYADAGLRYPPRLDERLDGAGAGAAVEAVEALGSAAAAVGSGREGGEGAAAPVNPEAARRLGGLSAKVKQLEAEIRAMGDAAPAAEVAEGEAEDTAEEEEFEIDSGAEEPEAEAEEAEEEEEEDGEEEEEEEEESDGAASEGEEAAAPADPATAAAGRAAAGGAADVDDADDAAVCGALFRGLAFFLGRETPREQLLLVARAFGAEVGWDGDGSPFAADDARVTHAVVDRPTPVERRLAGREYVQPQWVFDSANARVLVRSELYAPGAPPPPHLSPFVADDAEGYVPEYAKELRALRAAARSARALGAGAAAEAAFLAEGEGDAGGAAAAAPSAEEAAAAAERRYAAELAREVRGGAAGEGEEAPAPAPPSRAEAKARAAEAAADEAAHKSALMTNKVKRAYARATRERGEKRARVEELSARAAALKKGKAAK